MKLLTYRETINSQPEIGVLSKDSQSVIPIKEFGLSYETVNELIMNITHSESVHIMNHIDEKQGIKLSDVIKMAPIPEPRQDIICLGMNYKAHAEETAKFLSGYKEQYPKPIYFSKRVNLAVPDGGTISSHRDIVKKMDYEVELAVIIGKDARNIKPEEAEDFIFGYSIINDFSARDLQDERKQWYFGKSLDDFTAFGPWIVTKDEIPDAENLDIKCWVNGELRQNSNTSMLIHKIGDIISELSSGILLKSGTIIATGTPEGVGFGFSPPKFLKPGDVVKCEIQNIGTIENVIV